MSFPERIKLKAKVRRQNALKGAIGRKIAPKCHISAAGAIQHFMPYVKQIFKNDRKDAEQIAQWLDLDEEMIEYLSDSAARKNEI